MARDEDRAGETLVERLAAAVKGGPPAPAMVEGIPFPIDVTSVKLGFGDGVVQLSTTDGIWHVRTSHLIAIKLPELPA